MELRALHTEHAALGAENTTLVAENASLRAENEALRTEIATLRERVAALETRQRQTSRNSSKPPSSDPPWSRGGKPGRPKGKRPGGRPGHVGVTRALTDAEAVDAFVDHRPLVCEECGSLLLGEDPAPEQRQIVEPPVPRPRITEHRRHRLRCACCGHVTSGTLPGEVSRSAFGPRTHGQVTWLTGGLGLGKRAARDILRAMSGIRMTIGTVSAIDGRMAQSLDRAHDAALATARASPVVCVDETPWIEGQTLTWLWTMVTDAGAAFLIQDRRNAACAQTLLGDDFAGAICTDRHGAYNPQDRRGLCWAHLERNFTGMAEQHGGAWYGQRLSAAAKHIMRAWHAHDRGELDEAMMRADIERDRERVERLLKRAAIAAPSSRVRRQARALEAQAPQMWTFLETPGMPPTNNAAERALRRGVLWRKRSNGTRGPAGSRYAERILTVVETLRDQHGALIDHLADAYLRHVNQPAAKPHSA